MSNECVGSQSDMHAYLSCAPVIKPIYGAASIGVVKVTSLEDLTKTFARVTKEMSNACISAGAISAGGDGEIEGGNVRSPHLDPVTGCLPPHSICCALYSGDI